MIGRFVVRDSTLSVSDTSHSLSTSFSVHFLLTSIHSISFVVKVVISVCMLKYWYSVLK